MPTRLLALLLPALAWGQPVALEPMVITGNKLSNQQERLTGHVSAIGSDLSSLAPGSNGELASVLPLFSGAYEGFRGIGLFSLRGLNQDTLFASFGTGSNALIAVLEDGAPLSTATLRALPPLRWDLAAVEVLRGPQAVSHGPNSIGGAVLLHRIDPEFSSAGQAFAEHASFGTLRAGLAQNVVLHDRELALRLQVIRQQEDGQETNRFDGNDHFAATSRDEVRASLLWRPAGRGSDPARVKLDLVRGRARGNPLSTVIDAGRGDLFRRETSQNTPAEAPAEREAATLSVAARVATDLRLNSVSSFQHLDLSTLTDLDGTNRLGWFARSRKDERRLTEDLTIASPAGRQSWVLGAYAERSRYQVAFAGVGLTPLPFGSAFDSEADETVTHVSLYARGEAEILPRVFVNGGVRWTRERRTLDLDAVFGARPHRLTAAATTEADLQPQAALAWRPSPGRSFGIQFSQGTRGGGTSYAPLLGVLRDFGPEQAREIEVFARLRAVDSFRLSAALFDSQISDQQVPLPVAGGFPGLDALINNIASSRRQGFEAEARWRARSDLTVTASVAWMRTEFRHLTLGGRDRSGQALPNVPRASGSLGLDYRPGGGWFASALFAGAASSYSQVASPQVTALEPRRVLSARFGHAWKRARLHVFGANLLGSDYALYRSDNTTLGLPVSGKAAPGRTFGLGGEVTW